MNTIHDKPEDLDDVVDEYDGVETQDLRSIAMGGAFERHGQTILQLLIAGLLAWFGLQVVNQGQSVARMEVTVTTLAEQMVHIQTTILQRTENQYRRVDAERDHDRIYDRMVENERRLLRLENLMQQYLDSRIKD